MTLMQVRVMLDRPWTNAAGRYVAGAENWYRESGLDVALTVIGARVRVRR